MKYVIRISFLLLLSLILVACSEGGDKSKSAPGGDSKSETSSETTKQKGPVVVDGIEIPEAIPADFPYPEDTEIIDFRDDSELGGSVSFMTGTEIDEMNEIILDYLDDGSRFEITHVDEGEDEMDNQYHYYIIDYGDDAFTITINREDDYDFGLTGEYDEYTRVSLSVR